MSDNQQVAEIYYMAESPPCRTVWTVAKILNIFDQVKFTILNLATGEHLKQEFLQINPFHQIPTLNKPGENGLVLWESRLISCYLIEEFKPDSKLYPTNDSIQQKLIQRWLYFETGTLYRSISDVIYPVFKTGKLNLDALPRLEEVLGMIENYFKQFNYQWIAGTEQLSIGDISAYFTLKMCEVFPDEIKLEKFEKLFQWYQKIDDYLKQLDQEEPYPNTLQTAQDNLKNYILGKIEEFASKSSE